MFKIRKKRFQSILFSWLISYVSILIIPLILGLIVYGVTGKVLKEEINRADKSLLMQIQNSMDSYLRNVENLSIQIAINKNIQSMSNAVNPLSGIQKYNRLLAVNNLQEYNAANEFIENIYVYFKKIDTIITNTVSIDSKGFYDSTFMDGGIEYNRWNQMINTLYTSEYVPVHVKALGRRKINYIMSIPGLDGKSVNANIVIVMDESILLNLLNNIDWFKIGDIFIIDKNDSVIASSSNNVDNKFIDYKDMSIENGILSRNYNGEEYTFAFTTSTVNGWKYISRVPTSIFWEKSQYIRNFTLLSWIISLLIGFLVVYIFLRNNYKQVNDLLYALSDKIGITYSQKTSEYQFIKDAMSKIVEEKEDADKIYKKQKNILKSNYISRLLKGRVDSDISSEDFLYFYDMKFNSNYFTVILFFIEDFESLFINKEKASCDEKLKLVHFIIANVVEELACQNNKGYMCEVDSMLACLININEENVKYSSNEISRIAEDAKCFIDSKFNIRMSVSFSIVHEGISEISEAYKEALKAMEYKLIMGRERIIPYEQVIGSSNSIYYSLEKEQQLINYIKIGDFEKAKHVFTSVINRNILEQTTSPYLVKLLIYDVLSTIVKINHEIKYDDEQDSPNTTDSIEKVMKCNTIEEMQDIIIKIIFDACEYVAYLQGKNDNKAAVIEAVTDIIVKDYKNLNLNISTISQQLNLNPDYLSRLFKQSKNEAMLDYINKYRIMMAKKYLTESNIAINKVGKEVGYSNTTSFIRVFKKYEGITPGEYKKLH